MACTATKTTTECHKISGSRLYVAFYAPIAVQQAKTFWKHFRFAYEVLHAKHIRNDSLLEGGWG